MPRAIKLQEGTQQDSYIIHTAEGHSYHFNKRMKGGRIYARCCLYYKTRRICTAAISFDQNTGIYKTCGRHCHPPPRFLQKERELRHALLTRCRDAEETKTLHEIYHEERTRLRTPNEAVANIPFVKVRRSMELARREGWPELPTTLTELANLLSNDQHKWITASPDGEDNIYAGVVGRTRDRTRCVLLLSQRQRRYLNENRVKLVFSDGTFIAPENSGCAQILNLVTLRRKSNPHIIPLGSILMQSKLTACYVVALQAIRQMCPNFRPTKIICDFEFAEQSAWRQVFPNAERHGCFFHHTNDVCQKAKELGLRPLVRQNEDADSIVRSLCAIPLLKTESLVDGFEAVIDRAIQLDLGELADLFAYYRRTWLIPCRLPILSVYKNRFRTSNACESYNASMYRAAKRDHPNIFQLLKACVKLEDYCNTDHAVLNTGEQANRARRSSALVNDRRIAGLTEDLEDGEITVEEFLRRASRRIQGVYDNLMHDAPPEGADEVDGQ
ncbi:Hydroxyacylglutathione hydrolase [Frankliniella fusca]|uniref:Hydroxyacylglutathione hydrolase n=1 Tax=Frankliniella fusca TaxID=407009 RepID=A0AAE1GY51_9NEOP|nr:Hydroxyacylglutathione hydrolase [Frankliniella fusca]